MRLIPVEPGTFTMGSNQDSAARPAHKVTLTRMFWIGRNEVTQDQYFTLMRKNPSHSKGAGLPVERVTWYNAVEFCKRLTERERAAERLPRGLVYRLPTEAEWEYCCRAGSKSDFHFGSNTSQIGEYGWVRNNSARMTHEVARKLPNPWGLYDMHGNVLEWVLDRYGKYPSGAATDPIAKGRRLSRSHVVRGGCWNRSASSARASERTSASAGRTYSYVGFRVVLGNPVQ
jgi:formylglycine-generating enzyme required for sulfatase activity